MAVGWYVDRPGRRSQLRLAFKPSGAPRFQPPVDIGPQHLGTDAMTIVLGPDGGGAAITSPDVTADAPRPTVIRLISPRGTIGPGITVPARPHGAKAARGRTTWMTTVRGAYRADGTLGAVVTSYGFDARTDMVSSSWFVTVGPRGKRLLQRRRLLDSRYGLGIDDIEADRRGTFLVLVDGDEYALFRGTARTVRRVRGFRPGESPDAVLGVLPGGIAGALSLGRLDAEHDSLFLSRARSPQRFSPRSPIISSIALRSGIERVTGFVPLADGRVAFAWGGPHDQVNPGDSFISIASPPPLRGDVKPG